MTYLSAHFTLEELTRSDYATRKGLDNTPDLQVLENLRVLAQGLERVRAVLAVPVHISSGYRSPKLNSAVGGSKTSAHMKGLAADFVAPAFGPPREVAEALAAQAGGLGFDQLIWEGTWVHIGFPEGEDAPRGQVLTARFTPKGVIYTRGVA